ncbi:MAG: glycosyltransferase family 4 protein [Bacilli bacterium]|jgi:glycosyltransferase involved in cell wall biosynthesis|nr:glycosyltransferase family 4 protein [Bacilli bacterium]
MNHKNKLSADIYLVHPYRQHSLECAAQLQKSNFNFKYITSNYYKDSIFMRLLPKKICGKIAKKQNRTLPDDSIVTINTFTYYFSRILYYIHAKWLFRLIDEMNLKSFSRKVGRMIIKNHIKVLISYDRCSSYLYRYLNKHNSDCLKILDVTILGVGSLQKNMSMILNGIFQKEQCHQNKETFSKKNVSNFEFEYRDADYCLAGSNMVKESLVGYVKDPSKVIVINYGSQVLPKETSGYHDNKSILFVGAINYRKGLDMIYEIASQMKEYRFTLVGKFEKGSVLYKELKTLPNVNMVGFIDNREYLERFYQQAGIFLLPSRGEGLPLVLLDAISYNLIPVCSMFCGSSDIIKNNGVIVQEYSVSAFINAIRSVNKTMFKTTYEYENLSWDNYGSTLSLFLRGVLGE